MNILEGVKPANPKLNTNNNKFIIKSKPSVKDKQPV